MKKRILLVLLIALAFCLASCGHWDGSNPVGVTGGGSDGYGSANNTNAGNGNSGGDFIDSRIVGDWYYYKSGKYYYYTFQEDGDLYIVVEDGYDVIAEFDGTYTANGSTIVMRIDNTTTTYTYQIQSDKIYLTDTSGYSFTLIEM